MSDIGCLFSIFVGLSVINANEPLNKKEVHDLYIDGEFKKVSFILEEYRKNHQNLSKKDKIFIYKHLSVVYAANPDTRDKGEVYMFQLLKILPTALLIDMYISENIQLIFANVKKDFNKRGKYTSIQIYQEEPASAVATIDKHPQSGEIPVRSSTKSSHKKWIWWTASGLAVASGITLYIVFDKNESKDVQRIGPKND